MKMAKASETDLRIAMDLSGALDALSGIYPTVPKTLAQQGDDESPELFDREDPDQCRRVLGNLLDLAEQASLSRVVFGCAVMLDPKNRCVNPDADVLELHPDAAAGIEALQAIPLAQWHEEDGAVLWWRFPVEEAPWCGTPIDSDWPGTHTHWTRLIVPKRPESKES